MAKFKIKKLIKKKFYSVGELPNTFELVTNDSDVQFYNRYFGKKAGNYDGFFIKIQDGDIKNARIKKLQMRKVQ